MKNKFYVDNKLITDILIDTNNRNKKYFLLEDGSKVEYKKVLVQRECQICHQLSKPFKWYSGVADREGICPTCRGLYDNPFYGRHHTEETRQLLREKLLGKMDGEKNPFYGRHHTEETKNILREKSSQYYKSLDEKGKQLVVERFKRGMEKLKSKNYEQYIENKRKAAHASRLKQGNYKKSSIEKKVEEWLQQNNIEYEYSCIMGDNLKNYQYDFIVKHKRILIEVQGDYWHGNPLLFNKDGVDGKRILNETQMIKMKKDEEKKKFALQHNFTIIYIWESDINKNDFSILENLKND